MIESIENRLTYKGDGNTTEFPVTFPFLEKEDVVVATVSPENQVNILIGDYFLDAEKGAVIYPGYPPGENPPESEQPPVLGNGWKLVIYRDIRITQEVSLGDRWPFNVTEDALDKLTLICQDLSLVQRRSLRIPESISDTFDPTLPDDLSPGQSIQVKEDGTGFEASNYPEKAAGSASEAAQSEVNAKNSEIMAEKWAQSTVSPDNIADSDSPTGLTQSSRTWALTAKEWVDGANNSINNYREQAVNEITKLHSDAVHNINGTYDGITEDLNERHMNAVQDITNAHSTAMTDIAGGESDALNAITTAGDAYKADLQALANKAEDSADAAEESKADAESAAEEARAAANTAGSASAPAWDAETTYNYPDVVAYIDGYAYRCIGQNVVGEAPGSSDKWVIQTLKSFFDTDGKGDVMPAVIASYDDEWELDEQDDMMPKQ